MKAWRQTDGLNFVFIRTKPDGSIEVVQ